MTVLSTHAAFGWAWLATAIALALHVADEASHDFLSWYNPQALRIRHLLHGIPFPPTFTFWPWLMALAVGVGLLGALTPLAFAGAVGLRPLAYFLAAIHILNGMLHITATVVGQRAVPGVWSAPLLLVTGTWLGYAAGQLAWRRRLTSGCNGVALP